MHNPSAILACLALACAGSAPARAQDVTSTFSPSYQQCVTYGETHNSTAIPETECNARELRRQDAALNASYKAVAARLTPVRRADLRTDERNWIAARDHKCGAAADAISRGECVIAETMKRTQYLRRYR